MYKQIFLFFLKNKEFKGVLHLSFAGIDYTFGQKLLPSNATTLVDDVTIRVMHKDFFKRVIIFGDTGFGESFFMREFETDDIKKTLLWFVQNSQLLPGFRRKQLKDVLFEWGKLILNVAHSRNRNTKEGSRRNIKNHYDVSNDFYSLWLDATMTYSSAVFTDSDNLENAQLNKYRKICENITLKKGEHVLEIGSGWGGFALYAAKNFDCKVTTITISEEQFVFVEKLIREQKLEGNIEIKLLDYRELDGLFDKIVSIEMMEALGHDYVPIFIQKCNRLLVNGGMMCLQFITYPDQDFDQYLNNSGFIKKYIFPGAELLSLEKVNGELTRNNLNITHLDSIGQDYAKTLHIWRNNFINKKKEILSLGFDEEFFYKWLYYFVYCEVGFETKYIDNYQVFIHKE
ncbi:MAG: cyclopropane-fatty-acyl-phospholipid synthase family protein [Candidatus Falkowbacteria bacterium]